MPVYHFILHAYGSWHPDNEDGWHQHGGEWRLRQNIPLGRFRRSRQRWDSASFSSALQSEFLAVIRDICDRRAWRCHAATVNASHIHILLSWAQGPSASYRQATFKRVLGWHAAKWSQTPGRRWFSDGGQPRRVENLEHLHHLLQEYLPKQGGVLWKEGAENPSPPA